MGDPSRAGDDEAETRTEVRSWLDEHWSADGLDRPHGRAWLETVVDARWAVPAWPEAWWGRGWSPERSRIVAEEFRRVGAGGAGQDFTQLFANSLLAGGSDDLKRRHLRDLLIGVTQVCLLYSEPGAGSDLAGVRTRADRDGEEWVINGQKVWTSGARHSDFALLIARTDWEQPKHRGITFFWFPMDQPGVEVRPLRQATGDARFNEVFLTDARVPDANVLGERGKGWYFLQTALAYERAAMGGTGVGTRRRLRSDGAERAVDDEAPAPEPDLSLVDLARDRGRSDDPVVRQEIARLHVLRTVNHWNDERAKAAMAVGTSTPLASLGKLAMSRILHSAGSLQASILGPEGTLAGKEFPVAADATYAMLNAYFWSIGGGTDQIQRNIIGERILGLPREPENDRDVPFRQVVAGDGTA